MFLFLRLNVQFAHTSMEIIYLCIYFILCSISSFSHFHFQILNFNLGFNPNSQLIILFLLVLFSLLFSAQPKQPKLQYDAWIILVVLIICFLICGYYHVMMSMRQNIG
jgi:hypothetical protein